MMPGPLQALIVLDNLLHSDKRVAEVLLSQAGPRKKEKKTRDEGGTKGIEAGGCGGLLWRTSRDRSAAPTRSANTDADTPAHRTCPTRGLSRHSSIKWDFE